MNLFNTIWQVLSGASTKNQAQEVIAQPVQMLPLQDPNRKTFTRVPEQFATIETSHRKFHFAIIELETLGPDPKTHPILEIGILKGCFTAEEGITEIANHYWSLNDPLAPLPEAISRSLGMTDLTVNGQFIDWHEVLELIQNCDLIICHNSRLKRNFLEIQTPDYIQAKCKELLFACMLKDIHWTAKGLEASNLKLLTYTLDYFYDNKRVLSHCWAMLNILNQVSGVFAELKNTVKKRTIILCIIDNKLDRNSLLKLTKYSYTDGSRRFPKCWWTMIDEEALDKEMRFLENEVLVDKVLANSVTCYLIPSKMKHSSRFKETAMHPNLEGEGWVLRETEPALAN